MRKIFTILAIVLAICQITEVSAQEKIISGQVTSEDDGATLPGVNILIKGTTQGTVTDIDGNYKLSVPDENSTLVFSFIGYQTKETVVGNRSEINMALKSDVRQLDEVVVTSFGIQQEKKALGYSVQEVNAEEIEKANESNIVNSLQGKIAGVTINNSSGAPGSGSNIIIRGITSLSPDADNQPLFVVDGIPISNETIAGNVLPSEGSNSPASAEQFSFTNRAADLNPDDIESISILKGSAATALYGLRAANGAVIITTKKGTAGKASINLNTSVGWEEVNKFPDIQTRFSEGRGGRVPAPSPFAGTSIRFWSLGPPVVPSDRVSNPFEDFFETGMKYSNSLSLSGGNENTTYYTSVSRLDQEGVVPNTDYDRTTVKLSGSSQLFETFNVRGSVSYSNSGGTRPTGGDKSIMSSLSFWPTTVDINDYVNPDGTQNNFSGGIIDNPRFFAENSTLEDEVNRIIGNVGLNYNITDWLDVDYQAGVDFYNDSRTRFVPPNLDVGSQVNGFIIEEEINYREINSNFLVTARHSFSEDLQGSLLIGNQITDIDLDRLNIRGEGLNIAGFRDLSNATNFFTNKAASLRRIVGVFADAKLEYKGTLFLSVTGRNDWSSTLPEGNRSFFYPSVSLGYVFSETLGLTGSDIFTYGKVRASWAEVGKDAPPFRVGSFFEGTPGFPFGGAGGFRRDLVAGSEDLEPETTRTFEIGTDLRFFNNRVSVDATYFRQSSQDQIVNVPVSSPSGFDAFFVNAGKIVSNGVELLVSATPVEVGDFRWDVTVNWSTIDSEVKSMPEGLDVIEFASTGLFPNVSIRLEEGGSPGDIFGFRFKYSPDGQLWIADDGFPTIVTDSVVKVGNALPDWQGGITNNLSWKGLELSFLLEFREGGELYDASQRNGIRNGNLAITSTRWEEVIFNGVKNVGTEEEPVFEANDIPVEITEDFYRSSSRFNRATEILVQDASWIRLRNVRLAYELPNTLVDRTPFSRIKFSVTGNNVWLETPFRGYDPEGSQFAAGSNVIGFTGLNIPPTRSYSIGLNLTL